MKEFDTFLLPTTEKFRPLFQALRDLAVTWQVHRPGVGSKGLKEDGYVFTWVGEEKPDMAYVGEAFERATMTEYASPLAALCGVSEDEFTELRYPSAPWYGRKVCQPFLNELSSRFALTPGDVALVWELYQCSLSVNNTLRATVMWALGFDVRVMPASMSARVH